MKAMVPTLHLPLSNRPVQGVVLLEAVQAAIAETGGLPVAEPPLPVAVELVIALPSAPAPWILVTRDIMPGDRPIWQRLQIDWIGTITADQRVRDTLDGVIAITPAQAARPIWWLAEELAEPIGRCIAARAAAQKIAGEKNGRVVVRYKVRTR